jgi:hypothetical protein
MYRPPKPPGQQAKGGYGSEAEVSPLTSKYALPTKADIGCSIGKEGKVIDLL